MASLAAHWAQLGHFGIQKNARDLGVYLSADYTWTYQVGELVSNARKSASWVRSLPVMIQLYKSLIRSRVEYCCPLWNPYLAKDIQVIEDVRRYFTSRISGLSHLSDWERLSALNLLSLQRRRERYIIIHTRKSSRVVLQITYT